MTPAELDELERLERKASSGDWIGCGWDEQFTNAIRVMAPALFAALREAWRERDEARAALEKAAMAFDTERRRYHALDCEFILGPPCDCCDLPWPKCSCGSDYRVSLESPMANPPSNEGDGNAHKP